MEYIIDFKLVYKRRIKVNKKEKWEYIKKTFFNDLKVLKYFGINYAIIDFVSSIIFRTNTSLGKKLNVYKHEMVKKYLIKKYGYLLKDFNIENNKNIDKNSFIWIFWWQGIENAPDIVKKCIVNIKKKANNSEVIIIDKSNYDKYSDIPEFIINKLNSNCMTITHFSDILRMELLYRNGGIWMDATLLQVDKLEEEIFQYPFYTINHGKYSDFHVCKGLWTGFFMASGKNNDLIKLFRDFFYEYWKKENYLITYLLIDCIISICYENNLDIKGIIDNIPRNNSNVFELQRILNESFNQEQYNDLCKNNYLFKLTYKIKFSEYKESKQTFYKKLIK